MEYKMESFPKPVRRERVKKPMNRIGKVGRRRLALVAELTEQATREGWINTCELTRVLRWNGVSFSSCSGPLTFCHSQKCSKRGRDPVLDREVARGCEGHHFFVLDLLPPA